MEKSKIKKQANEVLRFADHEPDELVRLLARFGLKCETVPDQSEIDGSYWGDEEAGLSANRLMIRSDTPIHSILHEASHYVCMDSQRRERLHTDASGGYDEENAVCYLQILLAEALSWMGRDRMFADMDAWGYTFRLGSAKDWFERDAEDAHQWLCKYGLISPNQQTTFKLRET